MSRIRNFLRQLKALGGRQPHIALLLDADLDFARTTPAPNAKGAEK